MDQSSCCQKIQERGARACFVERLMPGSERTYGGPKCSNSHQSGTAYQESQTTSGKVQVSKHTPQSRASAVHFRRHRWPRRWGSPVQRPREWAWRHRGHRRNRWGPVQHLRQSWPRTAPPFVRQGRREAHGPRGRERSHGQATELDSSRGELGVGLA